jgi:hypothetical protein
MKENPMFNIFIIGAVCALAGLGWDMFSDPEETEYKTTQRVVQGYILGMVIGAMLYIAT